MKKPIHNLSSATLQLRTIAITALVSLFVLSGACSPKPETLIPKIQQESQLFVDALNNCNAEQAGKTLPKTLLDKIPMPLGEWLQLRFKAYNSKGYRFDSAQVGVPQMPQTAGGRLVSFVPVRTTVVPDTRLHPSQMPIFGPRSITLGTFLVAVSDNNGRSWTFFEAGENRALADALLPDIAANLVFPGRLVDVETN